MRAGLPARFSFGALMDTAPDLGEALLRHGTIAIVHADSGGGFAFWNDGAEAIFGYTAAETLGRRIDLIVPPEYRDQHWTGFNRTIGSRWRGGDAWGAIEGLHKSGDRIALDVLLTPISDRDGRVLSIMGMFRRVPAEILPS
jgi:PAS domain S-box-containing protein